MAENDTDGRWPVEKIPIADIETFGKTLLYLGRQYAVVCAEIRKRGLTSLEITGLSTADKGRNYLRSWLTTLRRQLDDLAIGEEKIDQQAINDAAKAMVEADIPAAMEKLAAKRKKR